MTQTSNGVYLSRHVFSVMADTLSPQERSARMALIRHKDTKPEIKVRRLLHRLGYRFRLHGKLPGKPDIVFVGRRKAVFVHGCFWHRHPDPNCRKARTPRSNKAYWKSKFQGNETRDARHIADLAFMGWEAIIVWECQIAQPRTEERLRAFLGPPRLGNH